jgi:hypothetical protein
MSLEEAAKRARAKADVSIDPFDHMRANAMEGAVAAERLNAKHAANPLAGDTSDLPPWSEVSRPYGEDAAGGL